MIDRLKTMIGSKVFIEISNHRVYNGIIKDVNETHILLNDKFGEDLMILIAEIKLLQPKDRQIEDGISKKIHT